MSVAALTQPLHRLPMNYLPAKINIVGAAIHYDLGLLLEIRHESYGWLIAVCASCRIDEFKYGIVVGLLRSSFHILRQE